MEPVKVPKSINIRPQVLRKFDRHAAEDIIRNILHEELEGKMYESAHGGEFTKRISSRIHEAVRKMPCDWYKFSVLVVLGEKMGQGVKCAGGCLWDDDTDSLASASLNLEDMYCIATVFAVYCYHYECNA